MNAEFQRIARRDKKAFLSDQFKEIEEDIEWERLEISSGKSENSYIVVLAIESCIFKCEVTLDMA